MATDKRSMTSAIRRWRTPGATFLFEFRFANSQLTAIEVTCSTDDSSAPAVGGSTRVESGSIGCEPAAPAAGARTFAASIRGVTPFDIRFDGSRFVGELRTHRPVGDMTSAVPDIYLSFRYGARFDRRFEGVVPLETVGPA